MGSRVGVECCVVRVVSCVRRCACVRRACGARAWRVCGAGWLDAATYPRPRTPHAVSSLLPCLQPRSDTTTTSRTHHAHPCPLGRILFAGYDDYQWMGWDVLQPGEGNAAKYQQVGGSVRATLDVHDCARAARAQNGAHGGPSRQMRDAVQRYTTGHTCTCLVHHNASQSYTPPYPTPPHPTPPLADYPREPSLLPRRERGRPPAFGHRPLHGLLGHLPQGG